MNKALKITLYVCLFLVVGFFTLTTILGHDKPFTDKEMATGENTYQEVYVLNNPEIKDLVRQETADCDEKEIVKRCKRLTKSLHRFSAMPSKKYSQDQLSTQSKLPTHCVGYARTFCSLCNYAFQVNHTKASCLHARGPVKIVGIDLTKIVSGLLRGIGCKNAAGFFQDHDFDIVTYSDGSKERIDPSISAFALF